MTYITTGTKQLILSETEDYIIITLNNPKYKNALSEDLTPYLRKILKKISKNRKYKLMVIRGKGNSFCAGGNIKKMSTTNIKKTSTQKKIKELYNKQIELTYMISSLEIPTIAAITGPAAGAGFSLALSCDIRIGNKNAFFLSNYSKIGLTGDYGISWYLTNLLGASKAKEIMIINSRIYAKEANEIGLLNYYFKSNFENKLNIIIKNILSQPPNAIKLIKKNISFSQDNSLKKTLNLEAKHLIESSNSKEHKLAVENFKKS